jgi:purine nucleosidase
MAMHDPLAVGALIDPTIVRTVPLSVQVETKGELTTGMLVADRRPLLTDLKGPANAHVALDVNAARFLETFLHRLHTP